MHVVPDRGAVARIVKSSPESRQRRRLAPRGPDEQRDQMGFGIMILAQLAFAVGTRRVEIAQGGATPARRARCCAAPPRTPACWPHRG